MQLSKDDIYQIIDQYLIIYPEETSNIAPLLNFLETTQGDLYDRKNMDGHIVGSGIILDDAKQEILMIYHNTFQRYQQPGGHIDPGETPVQGSQRECYEETGLGKLIYLPIHISYPEVPIDIGYHTIAANDIKGEGKHWHFNFIYAFATPEKNTHIDDDGVSDTKRVDIESIQELLPRIPDKIRLLH